MTVVKKDKIFVGSLGELYYNTSYEDEICSLTKYKKIVINESEFFLNGLLWENVGKENEIVYYKYS